MSSKQNLNKCKTWFVNRYNLKSYLINLTKIYVLNVSLHLKLQKIDLMFATRKVLQCYHSSSGIKVHSTIISMHVFHQLSVCLMECKNLHKVFRKPCYRYILKRNSNKIIILCTHILKVMGFLFNRFLNHLIYFLSIRENFYRLSVF